MTYNQNSGWGASLMASLPLSLGKVFVVGSSSVVNIQFIKQVFGYDPDGQLRYFSTIASAVSAAVAGRNDVILVAPGHAETITAPITVNKAGVSIIGIGRGTAKPSIEVNGAVDGLNITGANVLVKDIHFTAPETDEATAMINIAAAGVTLEGVSGIGSKTSKNFVDCITIAAGADDLTIRNLDIYNSVVAVNSFISIEAAVARLKLEDVFCFGNVVTAGIIDGATATQINWLRVNVGVVGTTKPAATLDSNPTGMIRNSNFSGTSTTLAANGALGNAIRLFDVKVLEETNGSAQGALIPAVDAD
jgi:WD40 repeat protein